MTFESFPPQPDLSRLWPQTVTSEPSSDSDPLQPPPSPQTTSGPCCDLTVGGLDPARCYDFRVRASPRAAHYGLEAQPSEWTAVTRLSGAASAGEGLAWGCQGFTAGGWLAGPG